MDSRPTIKEIVINNIETAIDQRHEYDFDLNAIAQWYEGDAYLQNTVDTIREKGYDSVSDWEEATTLFTKLAEEAGLRFA